MDFYYNHSEKDTQIKSFEEHIDASLKINKPLIVHTRSAEDETYEILKNATKRNDLKFSYIVLQGRKNLLLRCLILVLIYLQVGCYI